MIRLKKTRINIIVGLTSMALLAGFAGYTTHHDATKNRLTQNSAPIAMISQEEQPILPKTELVVVKAEQQPPRTSVSSAVPVSPAAPVVETKPPVTVSPPAAPNPATTTQTAVTQPTAPQPAAIQQPLSASPAAPKVVAMADTTETPAPTKKKTTKPRAS